MIRRVAGREIATHVEVKVQELDCWLAIPPSPCAGKNPSAAWARGFSRRCAQGRQSYLPNPYLRSKMRACWEAGWKAADQAILLLQQALPREAV